MKNHPAITFSSLMDESSSALLFKCITGSKAYGTDHAHSDVDHKGIFILSKDQYLIIGDEVDYISDNKNDNAFFSLKKIITLLSKSNPNIIEMLFTPEEFILQKSPLIDVLFEKREAILTRQVYSTFVGYAVTQFKKAKGQNKWVHNPQPKELPNREDYCWIVDINSNEKKMPLRPVALRETKIKLSECHVASLEHCPNVYRLYRIGKGSEGVFRNGQVICQSIDKNQEHDTCIGLLIFNKPGFERAAMDHQNYWGWVENRNKHRWISQENGELDYDAKNVMHMFRLLLSAKSILEGNGPIVRFSGEQLHFLKTILAGDFSFTELSSQSENLIAELGSVHNTSKLPEHPNLNLLNSILLEITDHYES